MKLLLLSKLLLQLLPLLDGPGLSEDLRQHPPEVVVGQGTRDDRGGGGQLAGLQGQGEI